MTFLEVDCPRDVSLWERLSALIVAADFHRCLRLSFVQHPADVRQASAAPGVFDGALAAAQALGVHDFLQYQGPAVAAQVLLDIAAGVAEAVADGCGDGISHSASGARLCSRLEQLDIDRLPGGDLIAVLGDDDQSLLFRHRFQAARQAGGHHR